MTNTRNLSVRHPGGALPVIDLLSGEIGTPTAEDYAEGYVIDGECFARGQDKVLPFKRGAVMKAMPTRKPNSAYRSREHLLEREVEALIKAAKGNRHGLRDSTIILMMWRHGLRVSELCSLQWIDVDFEDATLYVRRAKGGEHGTHPIADDEIAALRALRREAGEQWLFTSERGGPFERAGIARMIERAGIAASLPFQCHPHQLRHACGYALVNRGVDTRTLQAFMGHRSITSTTRYAALAPGRFKNLWS